MTPQVIERHVKISIERQISLVCGISLVCLKNNSVKVYHTKKHATNGK